MLWVFIHHRLWFPVAGVLPCPYFRVSFKPPLWPNTAIFHSSCKTCSLRPPFHCCRACLLFHHWCLKSTSYHWIYCSLFALFPFSSFFPIPPNFRHLKSDGGLGFKTRVGKGAPGSGASCVEWGVPVSWDFNMCTHSRVSLPARGACQGFLPAVFPWGMWFYTSVIIFVTLVLW